MRSVFAAFIQSHPFITLCLIGAFVSFVGISNELWTPDEPRDAAIGRAMWESGDWIVPRLNGEPFLEKPPLYWWARSRRCSRFWSCDSNPRPGFFPRYSALPRRANLSLGRSFFSTRTCWDRQLLVLTRRFSR